MQQQKQSFINISNKTTATKTSAARANHRYQYRWNTIVDAIAKGKRATGVRLPFKMMIIAVVTNAESLVAVIVGIVARDRRDEEEEDSSITVTTTTAVTFIPAIMRIRVVLDVVGLHQEITMRRLEVVLEEEEEKEIIGHHRTTMWIPLDVALEVDPQREHHHHTGAVVVGVDRATTTITIDAKANANANALPALLAMEN